MPKTIFYQVKETHKDGTKARICRGSTGTKTEATTYAKHMRKYFGDKFNYRIIKV